MKRITEADLHKLPDLEIDETGYYFTSPSGRVRVQNAHPLDEQFASDLIGLLNVSKARRNCLGYEPQTISLDAGLRKNVCRNEYDHQIIKRMSIERRDEPIILLVCADGLNVIDGTHRLKRRMRDGLTDVKAYILRPETMAEMRVTMYRRDADGRWTQFAGMTDEELAAHIAAAKVTEAALLGRAI